MDIDTKDLVAELTGRMPVEQQAPNKHYSKEFMYWKKCSGIYPGTSQPCLWHTSDLGYITVGPTQNPLTSIECQEMRSFKHMEPLDVKYALHQQMNSDGTYRVAPFPAPANPGEGIAGPGMWQPLIENGGLELMPIQQMVELGWHRNGTLVRYFPELAEYSKQEIICQYCPGQHRYLNEAQYRQHVAAMHEDLAISESIGGHVEAAVRAVGKGNSFDPTDIAAIISAVMQAMREEDSPSGKTRTKSSD